MSKLFGDLEYICAYLDDLLVLSTTSFDDHLKHLDTVLARLSESGLKVNARKSHLCATEVEYLGYHIT
jgi:putative transposase